MGNTKAMTHLTLCLQGNGAIDAPSLMQNPLPQTRCEFITGNEAEDSK